jgi:putative ABC transport system permease protein
VAVTRTQGLKRSIERAAPGQVTVIDNLSDALNAARGDAILAKIVFLFLGLPGVLLAGYVAKYAGDMLARARRREQATLRARGAQPRHLVRGLTYTVFAVGALACVIGLVAGVAAVALLVGTAALREASVESLLISAALAVLAGFAITALALYLPGRRALAREAGDERRELEIQARPFWIRSRLDAALLAAAALVWIVTVLAGGFRPTNAEGQSVSLSFYTLLAPLFGWLGATLLGVRIMLWIADLLARRGSSSFGGPARGILRRSVPRRALMAASGAIAVALSVAFGSSLGLFGATYEAQKQADARFVVGGDVRVTPSVATQPPADLGDRLRVTGVTAVAPEAVTNNAIVGTDKKTLVAVDPAGFRRVAALPDSFFSGTTGAAAMTALENDPAGVLVATEMARTFNIQPGDQVKAQLSGPGGRPSIVTLHALALFKSFPGYPQGIDLVGNLSFYQQATGSRRADLYVLRTADPSPAAVNLVARRLRSGAGATNPILVETTATAFNRDASSLTALNVRGLGTLETGFAVVISAVGIGIFVFGLLLERRKEYVTMRALGMAASALLMVISAEAAVIAFLGLVVGGLVGLVMAQMFVQVLAPVFTVPPGTLSVPVGQLGTLGALVAGSVILASLVAGRSIRRLNPAELLREE